jgi:RNA polymerase sigma factor for flagellar operon FliA
MARNDATYVNPAIRNRETDPKRQMLYDNLGLVHMVVNRMYAPNLSASGMLEKGDLIQFGVLGLLDAVERFDITRGVAFSTYAVNRIRGSIQDELRRIDWIPRSVRKKDRDADAMTQQVEENHRQGATASEVMARMHITAEEYQRVLDRASSATVDMTVSLEDEMQAIGALATDEEEDPSEIAARKHAREVLMEEIEDLPEREQLVITLYYYEELTFKEIGRVLQLSESRVFQIHAEVIQRLRNSMKEE